MPIDQTSIQTLLAAMSIVITMIVSLLAAVWYELRLLRFENKNDREKSAEDRTRIAVMEMTLTRLPCMKGKCNETNNP